MPTRGRSTSRAKSPAKPKRSASPSKSKATKKASEAAKPMLSASPAKSNIEKYKGIDTSESGYEFGGPVGVTALMIWSHYILLYFW